MTKKKRQNFIIALLGIGQNKRKKRAHGRDPYSVIAAEKDYRSLGVIHRTPIRFVDFSGMGFPGLKG